MTFLSGLIWGEGMWIRAIFEGTFTLGKICWTCEWGKEFVVKVKWMWKDSLLKDFILFVYTI